MGVAAAVCAGAGLMPASTMHQGWSIFLWASAGFAFAVAGAGYVRGTPALPFASRRVYGRMLTRPHVLGEVFPARSATTAIPPRGEADDPMHEIGVVVDTVLGSEEAARLRRAFTLWFTTLDDEPVACRAVRARFGSATIVMSEEIFGPNARGGFLVRGARPDLPGWRLLIAADPGYTTYNPYRRGVCLTVVDQDAAGSPGPDPESA